MSELADHIEKEEHKENKISQSESDKFGYPSNSKRSLPRFKNQVLASGIVIRRQHVKNYNARLRHRSNPLSFK